VRSGGDIAQHGSTTLRDYLHVVRRRKWIIIQAVVLVPLAAVLFSLQQRAEYQASADVLLSHQNLSAALSGAPDPNANVAPDRAAQTQASLARVPLIAQRVIESLHLPMTTKDLLASSSVTPATNADILTFTVNSHDSALAPRLAAAYARQYTLYRRQLDTGSLEAARKEVQARIDQLKADGSSAGQLYANLVAKEQQLKTMEALQTANAFVVQTPSSATQVAPRPKRNAILGLVLGLGLGIGLAFLREALDTRVRSAQEVGDRLGLPLLARVLEPPKDVRAEDKLVMLADPAGVHAEAFRMLRTNLEFATLGREARTIMVTSAVEQEGKSTTIANLALALARGGQKVILVDLDLRRPYLEKFFDLRGSPGITQVVLGRSSLQEALVRVPIVPIVPSANLRSRYDLSGASNGSNGVHGLLSVLGSGPIPPDPGEFVASQALTRVLDELRESADVVLVDAPPVLHVGDAMVLSAKVDAMLIVSRMETVTRPMLAEMHRLLNTTTALKLGFVVTGAQAEEGYGYSYGYYARTYEPQPKEPVT
jgi:Mrp family chromosome partitioning ATPase/capsular polysaccharide biosynthesis protein